VNQTAYREILSRLGVASPAADHPSMPARLLSMSLATFSRQGQTLEIRVPWWPATLFFVPDVTTAEVLHRSGIQRERIWTASELTILAGSSSAWPREEDLTLVTMARREFGGEVVANLPSTPPT
jgi:hypothetical protein